MYLQSIGSLESAFNSNILTVFVFVLGKFYQATAAKDYGDYA